MRAALRNLLLISGLCLAGPVFAGIDLLSVRTTPGSGGTEVVFHFSAPLPGNAIPQPLVKPVNLLQLNFPETQSALLTSGAIVQVNSAEVKTIGISQVQNAVQANVQLQGNVPYELQQQGNDVILLVHQGENALDTSAGIVSKLRFQAGNNNAGVLQIQLGNNQVKPLFEETAKTLVITLPNQQLAPQWVSTMNVAEFQTVVASIVAANVNGSASLTLNMTEPFVMQQAQNNHILTVTVQSRQKAVIDEQDESYTGKRISLNFQNIPVRSVIQIIAEFTGINIVTSDSVQGNVSLRLKDVPWDQALDIVLKSRGLAQRQIGNVIYIGPVAEIADQEKSALQEQQQADALAQLNEEYFRLSYANASQLASILQSKGGGFLGPRGSVTVDNRTNTLLVRDTPMQLSKIQKLINNLDIPVPQILIEARIVSITQDGVRELGVSTLPPVVPGSDAASPPSLTPVVNPTASANGYTASAQGFINNGLQDVSGALGLSITGLPAGMNLNLELQALETEGNGKVISSPQLTVSDKQEAYIQQGSEIPYNESTSSGAAAIAFKKAVLSLRVTPQITPDGNIALTLDVTNDSPSNSQVGAQNIPLINTSEITTQVLVKNGETIVLGGIQVETKDHQVRRIPFLGDLPGVGWLFKSTHDENKTNQLLIFLTPKIVKGAAFTTGAG